MEVYNNVSQAVAQSDVSTAKKVDEKKADVKKSEQATTESKSSLTSEAAVYEKSDLTATQQKPTASRLSQMLRESENQVKSMKKLLESLIKKQAGKNAQANGTSLKEALSDIMGKIENGEDVNVEVDEQTRLEAQQAISEDGYYGVKQTSTRILDFAKALAGGDPDKLKTLRKATEDGFEAVRKMFGGQLPQVSEDTYKAVMAGFDEMEKAYAGEAK